MTRADRQAERLDRYGFSWDYLTLRFSMPRWVFDFWFLSLWRVPC